MGSGRKPREAKGPETQYCVRHIPQELSDRFDARLAELGVDRSRMLVRLMEDFLDTGQTVREKALAEVLAQDQDMPRRIQSFLSYHNIPIMELIRQSVQLMLDAAEKQWGVKL